MAEKSLLERLAELVKEKGNRWKEIAPVVQSEGYRDDDNKPFTDNAIRKRWDRHTRESSTRVAKTVSRTPVREQRRPAQVSTRQTRGLKRSISKRSRNFSRNKASPSKTNFRNSSETK